MKINIFIPKKDAARGVVDENNYSTWPDQSKSDTYVQVSITSDEFARLEDTQDNMGPAIHIEDMNELESRIFNESQNVTGGEFTDWFDGLNEKERQTYTEIYGH